jgi:hypothetical protein
MARMRKRVKDEKPNSYRLTKIIVKKENFFFRLGASEEKDGKETRNAKARKTVKRGKSKVLFSLLCPAV